MDRIIRSYLDNFSKSQELNIKKDDKLFEMFACYCVLSKEYNETFSLTDISTGNGSDTGIDGFAIIANNVLITSPEEFDDIVDRSNQTITDLKFILIQAKTSAKFSGGEIGTFGAGVQDLFKEHPTMIQNPKIKECSNLVSHIISKMVYVQNKPKCLLFYVTLGKWIEDDNLKSRIMKVKHDLASENIFSSIDFEPIDAEGVQQLYQATISKIKKRIQFPKRITLPEIENISEAYLGIIPAKEFLKLVSNDLGMIKSILYDNIRDFQGDNDVNKEISKTICGTNSNQFVVLNNGITIICKNLKNIVRDEFQLTDYQIVNGCQTSHVLYNNRDKISDNLFVSVKIISTSDEDTVNRIIKATNNQTEVSEEQLMSLGDFHKKLEEYYKTYTNPVEKLYYERRSKQYANNPDIEKVRIVTIPSQIKCFSSMFLDKPHLASRYYGRLIKQNNMLFHHDHEAICYYTSAYMLYKIEYLIRNKQIDQKYNKFRYHMLMLIKYLVLGSKKQPKFNSHDIKRLCQSILDILNEPEVFIDTIEQIKNILDTEIVDLDESENAKTSSLVEKIKDAAIRSVDRAKDVDKAKDQITQNPNGRDFLSLLLDN